MQLDSLKKCKGVHKSNFGYKHGFAVALIQAQDVEIISVTNANLNFVWLLNSNGNILEKAGDLSKANEHKIQYRYPVFNLKHYQSKAYYLVVNSDKRPLRIPVNLMTQSQFEKSSILSNIYIGAYSGFILLTVLVLLVFLSSTKNWLYASYAFFVLSYAFLPFVELGLAKLFIYPNTTYIEFHPLLLGSSISFIAFCLFAYAFFELHTKHKKFGNFLLLFIAFIAAVLLFWLLFPDYFREHGILLQLTYYVFLVLAFAFVWVITINSIKNKGLNGKLFAVGYGFFTLFSVLYFLIDAGKLPLMFSVYPPMLYSSLVEIIVLNTIVGYKIWNLNKERNTLISTVFKLQNEWVESIESARLVERKEISRWIHDKVGSRLSFIKLALTTTSNNLSAKELKDHITKLSHEIRELNASVDEQLNLKFWCESYFNELNSLGFTRFKLLEIDDVELSEKESTNFKLIIQELCNNVLKHAHASNAELQIIEHEDVIALSFEDDGVGLDDSIWASKKTGGFASIRDRLNMLNAEYEFNSGRLKGLSLMAEIPKIPPRE